MAVIVTLINAIYGHVYFNGVTSTVDFLRLAFNPIFLIGAGFISLLLYIIVVYAGYLAVKEHKYKISEAFMTGLCMGLILFIITSAINLFMYFFFDYYRYIFGNIEQQTLPIVISIIIGFIVSLAFYGGLGALGGWLAKRTQKVKEKISARKMPQMPKKKAKKSKRK